MSRLPTPDDVLRAVPCSTHPAATIVRAAELYLRPTAGRPASSRSVAAALAAETGRPVHHSTVGSWLRALGLSRSIAEARALGENRRRVLDGRPAVDWRAVCAEYTAGLPVDDILARHGLYAGSLYAGLDRAGVPRRGADGAARSDRQRRASARRHRARELAAEWGVGPRDRDGKRRIAEALGVSVRTVRAYLPDHQTDQP